MSGKIIGITGGIGSGKSVVSRLLRCNGLPVYDCDFEAKRIMTQDSEIKKRLIEELGPSVYNEDGTLNRKEMAAAIFNDRDKRESVNKIVHDAVRNDIRRRASLLPGDFFVETAIPVTGEIAPLCYEIWLVSAPEKERIIRVEKRDNMSRSDILKRMKAQENEFSGLDNEKVSLIVNDDHHSLLSELFLLLNNFSHYNFIEVC